MKRTNVLRRDLMHGSMVSLGAMALSTLLHREYGFGSLMASDDDRSPIRPEIDTAHPYAARPPHFEPRAKQVLLVFCSGAISHLDTWDYKPELIRLDGQPMPGSAGLVTFQGENGNLTKSPWAFKPRGESGKMVSDLLPHLASLSDEFCFLHGMTAKANTHGPAENQMATGYTLDGFPSIGAWVSYALGSHCDNLPSFVAIPDPRGVPQIGPRQWSAGFLPSAFQGTAFNSDRPIPFLERPATISSDADRATREFLTQINELHREQHAGDSDLAARMSAYELAARMQLAASDVMDTRRESADTLRLYGADDTSNPTKERFAHNCILARRLLERGVRFVQLINGSYAMGEGVGNWDGHKNLLAQYSGHAPILDQPLAGLIRDMKQRGMLEDTLIVFVTEFGRMPTFQKGAQGRDHNPSGFTCWLAGAGVRHGYSHGATDEFGYRAVENVTTIYDLHATILHLLGLDHQRLSFYNNGIERRLTDVHGHVIHNILS